MCCDLYSNKPPINTLNTLRILINQKSVPKQQQKITDAFPLVMATLKCISILLKRWRHYGGLFAIYGARVECVITGTNQTTIIYG